jgi:hypothetical protein
MATLGLKARVEKERQTSDSVIDWLCHDDSMLIKPQQVITPILARNQKNKIYSQLPQLWKDYTTRQELHKSDYASKREASKEVRQQSELRVSLRGLFIACRARDAYIFSNIAQGFDTLQSITEARIETEDYRDLMQRGLMRLPIASSLNLPLIDQVNDHAKLDRAYGTPRPTYLATMGIVMKSLIEFDRDAPTVLIPAPTTSDNDLEIWSRPQE